MSCSLFFAREQRAGETRGERWQSRGRVCWERALVWNRALFTSKGHNRSGNPKHVVV